MILILCSSAFLGVEVFKQLFCQSSIVLIMIGGFCIQEYKQRTMTIFGNIEDLAHYIVFNHHSSNMVMI